MKGGETDAQQQFFAGQPIFNSSGVPELDLRYVIPFIFLIYTFMF